MLGRAIEANEWHQLKANFPIDVTVFGMVTDVNDVHPHRHWSGISVTLFGNTICFKLEQFWKALASNSVTFPGIVTLLSDLQL